MKIEKMELSARAYNALKSANIHSVEQLLSIETERILQIANVGHSTYLEICAKIRQFKPEKIQPTDTRALMDAHKFLELIANEDYQNPVDKMKTYHIARSCSSLYVDEQVTLVGYWLRNENGTKYCSNCGLTATRNELGEEIAGIACTYCGATMCRAKKIKIRENFIPEDIEEEDDCDD